MIKRKSRYDVIEELSKHPDWKIADLGSGSKGACPHANIFLDKNDHSDYFKDKDFRLHDLNQLPLPFEDK